MDSNLERSLKLIAVTLAADEMRKEKNYNTESLLIRARGIYRDLSTFVNDPTNFLR